MFDARGMPPSSTFLPNDQSSTPLATHWHAMSHYASIPDLFPLHGGCACGHIRYTLAKAPLAVHACHCPLCQRESGSGFTINAVIETEHIVPAPSAAPVLPGTNTPLGPPQPSLSPLSTGIASSPSGESAGQTIGVPTPTASHAAQTIHRCPRCSVAVWSFYGGVETGPVAYLRAATLDRLDVLAPDAHIFVRSKRGFVVLAAGTPRFEEHYRPDDVYRPEALERLRAVVGAGTSA
ncbi:glutathione-dependent formaldehyde-activating [Verticillium dahliae]